MMPPPHRPRNSSSGRPSGVGPMSERQQMALLMQMTSGASEAELSPNSQSNRAKDRNERGETPLHIAAKKGDIETAKKLLEQGSDPNVNDFAGWTPLHEAANHGHYHLAQLLVKHGANVMATGLDDMTPLHDAAAIGNQKLVKMLIDKGADPSYKNKKGKTPQDIAHISLVNFFIEMASKQQKKTDLKKSSAEEETLPSSSSSLGQQAASSATSQPSDIYEFVSTPKHSSCSSGDDENPIKAFDKSSLDDKSGTDSDTTSASQLITASATSSMLSGTQQQQQKRTLGDQQDRNDETLSPAEEDSKRKKRKDSEFLQINQSNNSIAKEAKSSSISAGANRVTSRVGQKPPGPASKTMGLISKGDRKSPCESPKITSIKSPAESIEGDNNDENTKSSAIDGGPKVPPLKIVIPQQQQQQQQQQQSQANQMQSQSQGSNENQDGQQVTQQVTNNQRSNNKSGTSRNPATSSSSTLPYVLNASSNDSCNSNDKQESTALTGTTRSLSPSADSTKSNSEENKLTGKSKETRVTRSSQRGGKDSKDDRSSNNSSPQLPASSTPSPAAQNSADSSSAGNESESNGQQVNNNNSTAPLAPSTSISNPINSASTSQTQNQQQAQASTSTQSLVELHPRKRKIKTSSNKDQPVAAAAASSSSASSSTLSIAGPSTSSSVDLKDSNSKDGSDKSGEPVHPHDQPFTNCYQMYIDLRKQIEQRHRNLHPIEPRPLKGLEDYLMNRRTYSLNGKTSTEPNIIIPPLLPTQMKDTFLEQEKERHKLKMKHNVEKEKLVLSKEQEILRVHCKAAQMQAGQPQPFSVCTILKDEEVYNPITPDPEERYNNRYFFKELKDLDDKWDKIKEAMIIRHTNEAESLHAVQKMDWGWKLKEFLLCDYRATPEIEELHVPMVDVSDEYTTPSIKN